MGSGSSFSLKRLVREYGKNSDIMMGKLSIAGTVPHSDVVAALDNGSGYKLSIV